VVEEEYDLTWGMSELQDQNEELKNDNRLLRELVAELSLEKLKAEQGQYGRNPVHENPA
jgi:hypothetical protein